jgi:hypothetical protein
MAEVVGYRCTVADKTLDYLDLAVRDCSSQWRAVIAAFMFDHVDSECKKVLNRFDQTPTRRSAQ